MNRNRVETAQEKNCNYIPKTILHNLFVRLILIDPLSSSTALPLVPGPMSI